MKIGLLGHGVVGSGVRKIIDDQKTIEVQELEVKRILVKDDWEMTDERMTQNADDILNDPEIDIVAECMGGLEPAHTFVRKALEQGKHVVTSNKKMLATYCRELFAIANEHGVTVHYEAACGGGIPWMAALDRIRRVDDIMNFRGIFNGTTNYILERMYHEGKDFSEMLGEAQKLGYAERDPSDDIDGFDVKYKVMLSAVKANDVLLNLDDITTFGIRHILKKDLDYCRDNGYVCKLIGRGVRQEDSVSACVMQMFLKLDDMFASTPLNFNVIECEGATLGKAAFTGQGAGSLPTAHAVVQNIIDIWKNQDSEINPKLPAAVDNRDLMGVYYIRTKKSALFADITDRYVGEDTILTEKISLSEAALRIKNVADPDLFIAEVAE